MNYSVYILSGLILWFSFLESFTKGSEIFIEYSNLLKKQFIPFNYLFCTSFFSGLFIGILYLILLNIVFIFGDYIYSLIWTFLFSLLVFFISLFGSILGFFYAILNLVIFDLKHLKPIILFILFWSTPIIYPQFILDNAMQSIVKLNPLSYFVNLARDILQGKFIYNEFIYLFFFTLLIAFLFIIFLKKNATFIRDNV